MIISLNYYYSNECLVYDKTLRMTVQSGADAGSTVNLMSIDAYNMFMVCHYQTFDHLY